MCKNERIREGISFDPRKPTFNFRKINKRGGPNKVWVAVAGRK